MDAPFADEGFQFALPRGERHPAPHQHHFPRRFNSRSREGSDGCLRLWMGRFLGFQFALPRGERRKLQEARVRGNAVSIRAPARGATKAVADLVYRRTVSIRAPARGATRLDRDGDGIPCVSIRAPARGATGCGQRAGHRYIGFNSRSREGSDTRSTTRTPSKPGFNSRSREGSDQGHSAYIRSLLLFQFALPRGERQSAKRDNGD